MRGSEKDPQSEVIRKRVTLWVINDAAVCSRLRESLKGPCRLRRGAFRQGYFAHPGPSADRGGVA